MAEFTAVGRLGPSERSDASEETDLPSDPLSLEEYDETEPFVIGPSDAKFLEQLSDESGSTPLDISFTSDRLAILSTGSHVGVITLPSGAQIEVTPKRSVTRLLWAIHYAYDAPVDSLGLETGFTTGSSFFDAIGVLFLTELRAVLDRGLHREYVQTHAVEEYVRGRIDVHRQIHRSPTLPTDFSVEYDEFTPDTTLNRGVLLALRLLVRLVRDDRLANRLRHHEHRLREFVSVERISLEELDRIELSRLNDHYETLLELTKTVLTREFFDDVRAGERRSLALFVDMNDIFERIVERAFQEVTRDLAGLSATGQASIPNIVDGPHAISMRPDIVIRRDDETPVAVVDAKWKTGSRSAGDVYQMTSYMLALEAPGALMYPARGDGRSESSRVNGEYTLRSVEIATNADVSTYEEYVEAIELSAHRYLQNIGYRV